MIRSERFVRVSIVVRERALLAHANKPSAPMKLVMTGGGGFIGGTVLDRLFAHDGNLAGEPVISPDVRVLASSTAAMARLRATFPRADVRALFRPDGSVEETAFHDRDVFLHCGWSTVPSTAEADPVADLRSNVEGGLRMIEAAVKGGVRRIIFLSSGGTVYGEPERTPITEGHPTRPTSAYGIGKLGFERYLGSIAAHHGLEHLILRPSNVYGRRVVNEKPQGVVEHWMFGALHGTPVEAWNDLSMTRDYLFVEDLVDVIVRSFDMVLSHSVVNVGTGRGTSLAELAAMIEVVSGHRLRIDVRPSPVKAISTNVLDTSRQIAMFGAGPRTALEEGLRIVHDRIRAAG